MNPNFAPHRGITMHFEKTHCAATLWIMMQDQNKCVMTLEDARDNLLGWQCILPYWKESLSGLRVAQCSDCPECVWILEMSALDRRRLEPVYWSLVNEGFIWDAAVFNYMVIYWSETMRVCLQRVKMNLVGKNKVSGKLADEGLHLI